MRRVVLSLIVSSYACASHPSSAPSSSVSLEGELLEMGRIDQAMQFDPTVNPIDAGHDDRTHALYRKNAARIDRILADHGWPSTKDVGPKAEQAVFLVVQHADFDVALQRRGLALLEPVAKRGDAPLNQLVLLTDRVRKNEGRPQLYGTQFKDEGVGRERIRPIEDEAHVDDRRRAVGLRPLDEEIADHEAFERDLAAKMQGATSPEKPNQDAGNGPY